MAVNGFNDIALPFYTRFGELGVMLFAVAFACVGITAVITVGIGGVYVSFGFLGYREKMRQRGFKLLFIAWLIAATALSFLPNQIEIMVYTQYLRGVFLPLILIPLVYLARDKEIIGRYKIGGVTLVLSSVVIAVITVLFILSLL